MNKNQIYSIAIGSAMGTSIGTTIGAVTVKHTFEFVIWLFNWNINRRCISANSF